MAVRGDGTSRIGKERYNKQGCLMKIIEYNGYNDVLVEFQDEYKYKTKVNYNNFKTGAVKNLYYPSVYGVGIIGDIYPVGENGKQKKEYKVWQTMLQRCFDPKWRQDNPAYEDVTCSEEWLFYPDFYDFLHSQSNFDKWNLEDGWHIDKDIIDKNAKMYCKEFSELVNRRVNALFIKRKSRRGEYPIGVHKHKNKFAAECNYLDTKKHLGYYDTPEDAFYAYKEYKEALIKRVADEEYALGNITERCRDAMYAYEVEITD